MCMQYSKLPNPLKYLWTWPSLSSTEGASIYDVQTEGGGGSRKTANLRTNSIDFEEKEGGGVQKI